MLRGICRTNLESESVYVRVIEARWSFFECEPLKGIHWEGPPEIHATMYWRNSWFIALKDLTGDREQTNKRCSNYSYHDVRVIEARWSLSNVKMKAITVGRSWEMPIYSVTHESWPWNLWVGDKKIAFVIWIIRKYEWDNSCNISGVKTDYMDSVLLW